MQNSWSFGELDSPPQSGDPVDQEVMRGIKLYMQRLMAEQQDSIPTIQVGDSEVLDNSNFCDSLHIEDQMVQDTKLTAVEINTAVEEIDALNSKVEKMTDRCSELEGQLANRTK